MSVRVASRSEWLLGKTPRTAAAPIFCEGLALPFISDSGYISVTGSSTIHTKGAWTQLVSSTASQSALAILSFGNVGAASTNTSTLVDIGVGGAGSESVVIPNIAVGGYVNGPVIWVPIRIPAGSRVAARCQSLVSSKAISVRIYLFSHTDSARCPTSVNAIGADTATSAGVALSGASGSWTEIAAATAADFQALTLVPSSSATAGNNGNWRLSLGIGAAGSEIELMNLVANQTANPLVQAPSGDNFAATPAGLFVPTGTRIAVRHNITSNPGRLSAMVLGVPTV